MPEHLINPRPIFLLVCLLAGVPADSKLSVLDYTDLPSEQLLYEWAEKDLLCWTSVIDQAKGHELFDSYMTHLKIDSCVDDDYEFGSEEGDQLEDMADWLRWIRAHPGKIAGSAGW